MPTGHRTEPGHGFGRRAEADQDRDHQHDRHRECGLDEAAEDVAGEDGGPRDGHRPEAAMIPAVMSMATVIAVPCAVPTIVIGRIPGIT